MSPADVALLHQRGHIVRPARSKGQADHAQHHVENRRYRHGEDGVPQEVQNLRHQRCDEQSGHQPDGHGDQLGGGQGGGMLFQAGHLICPPADDRGDEQMGNEYAQRTHPRIEQHQHPQGQGIVAGHVMHLHAQEGACRARARARRIQQHPQEVLEEF